MQLTAAVMQVLFLVMYMWAARARAATAGQDRLATCAHLNMNNPAVLPALVVTPTTRRVLVSAPTLKTAEDTHPVSLGCILTASAHVKTNGQSQAIALFALCSSMLPKTAFCARLGMMVSILTALQFAASTKIAAGTLLT